MKRKLIIIFAIIFFSGPVYAGTPLEIFDWVRSEMDIDQEWSMPSIQIAPLR